MNNHHSGPRGPYRVIPESFRELLKSKTNWKKLVTLLNKLAYGGFAYQNYNGQTITAQPNLEAVRLMIYLAWGKPGESPADNVDAKIALADFNKIARDVLLPHNEATDVHINVKDVTEGFPTKQEELNIN